MENKRYILSGKVKLEHLKFAELKDIDFRKGKRIKVEVNNYARDGIDALKMCGYKHLTSYEVEYTLLRNRGLFYKNGVVYVWRGSNRYNDYFYSVTLQELMWKD